MLAAGDIFQRPRTLLQNRRRLQNQRSSGAKSEMAISKAEKPEPFTRRLGGGDRRGWKRKRKKSYGVWWED